MTSTEGLTATCAAALGSERGASCWLTTLPIAEHGFSLSKGEFHDALCLRFGWQPVNLPQTCVCGKPFCVEHAFTCPCGGFPSIRHNEVRGGSRIFRRGGLKVRVTAQCAKHTLRSAKHEHSRGVWGHAHPPPPPPPPPPGKI